MRALYLQICLAVGLTLSGCAARIDPAAKASVDRQLAALTQRSDHYEAPEAPEPMPLAVGQWTRVHIVDEKGNHAFLTTKIVGAEGSLFWLEMENESYYGNTATKMLVDLGDRRDPSTFDIQAYWLRSTDGSVEEYPRELLGMMKSLLRKQLAGIAIAQTAQGTEDISVPAGAFSQAYKGRVTTSVLGMEFVSDGWWHPAVPINGAIRSVSPERAGSVELVAFGESGATSVFPQP